MPLSEIDLVVLAGGRGTRLQPVIWDVPKIMAPAGGRPFLEVLLDWVRPFAPRRVILSLGYMAEKVTDYLKQRPPCGLDVTWVAEPRPLGTAGGLRFAFEHTNPGDAMAVNGDTLAGLDLSALLWQHKDSRAFLTMACIQVPCVSRYGVVETAEDGKISAFIEKGSGRAGPGLVNAGIYCFSPEARETLAHSQGASLEKDFFPSCTPGRLSVWSRAADFIDIGTPESYGEFVQRTGGPE